MYIQAHSDEQERDLISEEDMPLYQGHAQCGRMAVDAKLLVPASNVTFFFFWKAYLPIEDTLNGKRPRLVHGPRAGSTPRGASKLRFDSMHGTYAG